MIFCGLGINNTMMYNQVKKTWAKQSVALDVRLTPQLPLNIPRQRRTQAFQGAGAKKMKGTSLLYAVGYQHAGTTMTVLCMFSAKTVQMFTVFN